MTQFDDGEVVASRVFERDDGEVFLAFRRPRPAPDPALDSDSSNPPWRCDYSITFPDGELKSSYSMGVDGLQALLLALASASSHLRHVGDGTLARRPALRWLGQSDLGLTINHFD